MAIDESLKKLDKIFDQNIEITGTLTVGGSEIDFSSFLTSIPDHNHDGRYLVSSSIGVNTTEPRFAYTTYTDPNPGITRDAKFGDQGIAAAEIYSSGNIYVGANSVIHTGNIGSQSVDFSTTSGFLRSFDTRNSSSTPETYSASSGIHFDFKLNSTNGLSDGGSYNGVMYWRKYGGGSDWTGGGAKEIAYTDNGNLWHRYGINTSWGSWRKIIDSSNISSETVGNSNQLSGRDLDGATGIGERLFNNQGRNHDSTTNFNSTGLRAGVNFLQGGTNGPTGTATDQWYGFRLGLGADYGTTTGASQDYASDLFWGRQSQGNNKYLWARDLENGTWGSWRKMHAGYADDAGYSTNSGYASNAGLLNGWSRAQSGANVVLQTASNGYLYIGNWIQPALGSGLFYTSGPHFYESGGTMYSSHTLRSGSSVRGTIFYDETDTGSYLDLGDGYLRLRTLNNNKTAITHHDGANSYLTLRGTAAGSTEGWGWSFTNNDVDDTEYTTYFRVNYDATASSSYTESVGSSRAPIFYDRDNTGYYVDPSGTSNFLGPLNIYNGDAAANPRISLGRSASQRLYISVDDRAATIGHQQDEGSGEHSLEFYINSPTTSSTKVFYWKTNDGTLAYLDSAGFKSNVYYDRDNTGYYVNPYGFSDIKALRINENWGGSGVHHEQLTVRGTYPSIGLRSSQHDNNWLIHHENNLAFYDASGIDGSSWTRRFTFSKSGHLEAPTGSVYANSFIDQNNSSYYVDPSGTSNLNAINDAYGNNYLTRRHSGSDFTAGTLVTTDIDASGFGGISFVIEVTGKSYSSTPPFSFLAQGYFYNYGIINFSGVNNGDPRLTYIKVMELNGKLAVWWPRVSYWNSFDVLVRDANGATRNRVNGISDSSEPTSATKVTQINLAMSTLYGYNTNASTLYATKYYDADDTGYFLDVAGTNRMYELYANLATTTLRQAGPRWDTAFYVLQAQHWYGDSSSQDMYLGESGNRVMVRGRIDAPTFYDFNDTNYYLNPAGISVMNEIRFQGSASRAIEGTSVNGNNTIRMAGNWETFDVMGRVLDWTGSNMHFGDGYNGVNHSAHYFRLGSSGNINYFHVGGDGYFEGDVIAYYSDARLKQNVKPIENALDIIKEIRGVTFEWNKLSESVWKKKEGDKDFGLIAQEVEAVFPMGVAIQAGADEAKKKGYGDPDSEHYDPLHVPVNEEEEYKTVRYDKMVSVAIQAIKEQQSVIEELKQEIQELKKLINP